MKIIYLKEDLFDESELYEQQIFPKWRKKMSYADYYITDEEAALTGSEEGQATLQVEEINYLKNEQAFNYSVSYYFQKELSIYFHVSNYLH